ncbi:MAG: hypothetical protein IMY69_01605 [Bacteroidetes bacterium]|jgi:hypothetical protein|nr:hypothetical protein [Bacteroidota bacterium]
MRGNYFFEIPLFLRSEQEFESEFEARIQRELKEHERYKKYPEDYNNLVDHIRNSRYRDWEYNQIVGYLKLYRINSRIYADIWKVERKRYSFIIDKKVFKYQASYPDWDIDLMKLKTSNEIFEKLLKELPKDRKKLITEFHLDLRMFKTLGPYIDWVKLLEKYK